MDSALAMYTHLLSQLDAGEAAKLQRSMGLKVPALYDYRRTALPGARACVLLTHCWHADSICQSGNHKLLASKCIAADDIANVLGHW